LPGDKAINALLHRRSVASIDQLDSFILLKRQQALQVCGRPIVSHSIRRPLLEAF
jgi:hypothetical protein